MPPRLSLTMIVRNEEATLAACLTSVGDLAPDKVVADTGSTDATKEIALRHGARVFDFPWCDDFSAARNEALRHAQGDWILWLDADERLDELNRIKLRDLLASLKDERTAFSMKQRSFGADGFAVLVDQVRLFRRHRAIRWDYRVHEQIIPALNRAGHTIHFTDIAIDHGGYYDPLVYRRKLERNLRLLRLEQAERPDDPFTLFNLGWACVSLGQHADAVPLLRRSLERSHPEDSTVRKLYTLLIQCHLFLGQRREAEAACRQGRVRCPDDAELIALEASMLKEQGHLNAARRLWRQLADSDGHAPGGFASHAEGLRGFRARHELALIYREQGQHAEAEAHWRDAVAAAPDFASAWRGLADLFLAQERWPEFEQALAALDRLPHAAAEAGLLRARRLMVTRDFAAARQLLQEAIAARPADVVPRVLLTHALLQEDRDDAAAERALRDVVGLDPGQGESWRNLALLLRKHGRLAEAEAACRSGSVHCPTDADLALLHGMLLHERGDLTNAESCLLGVLDACGPDPPSRRRAVAARHQLALTLREQGRVESAAAQWRALVAEEPEAWGAWLALGQTCLALGREPEAEEALHRLGQRPQALPLRARLHLARREYAAMRTLLAAWIEQAPRALEPRILLSYAWLAEGSDPASAEQALRDVLQLDPGNAEAAHNLAIMHKQNGWAAL